MRSRDAIRLLHLSHDQRVVFVDACLCALTREVSRAHMQASLMA
jgi:hypothetical protein